MKSRLKEFCSLIALSVAGPAGLQLLNVVLLYELRSERLLRLGGLVAHGCHKLPGPDVFFGSAMTIEAPPHLQVRLLGHQRHLIDAAVASLAADALGDVNAVVEVNEIGQVVNLGPADGLVRPV